MDRIETEKTIKNYFTNLKNPVPVDTMVTELTNLLDDTIRPGDEVIFKDEESRNTVYGGLVFTDACGFPFVEGGMAYLIHAPEDCCFGYLVPKNNIIRKTGIHIDPSDLPDYIKENYNGK